MNPSLCESYGQICELRNVRSNRSFLKALAEAPPTGVEVVDLTRTFVGTGGLLAIAHFVAVHTTTSRVVFRDQRLDSNTLGQILGILDGASHVTSLDLSRNPITQSGARALAVFLRCNANIVRVCVDGTNINTALRKCIEDHVHANAGLSEEERKVALAKQQELREQQRTLAAKRRRTHLSQALPNLTAVFSALSDSSANPRFLLGDRHGGPEVNFEALRLLAAACEEDAQECLDGSTEAPGHPAAVSVVSAM